MCELARIQLLRGTRVEELQFGSVSKTCTWGLELIAQTRPQPSPNPALVNYYVCDLMLS